MGYAGNELYHLLIQLTGIDAHKVTQELNPILVRLGMSPATLTLDDVRKAMLVYLEDCSAHLDSSDVEAFAEIEGLMPEQVEA